MSNTHQNNATKIMVFGTFDGLHAGHLDFFRQARDLARESDRNPFLIVSIARDKNVFQIKNKFPELNERKRMALVGKCSLVDKVVLAGALDHIPHIVREHPEIIALGYDQVFYTKNLKKDLKNKGLDTKIIRLEPYKEKIYKNDLLKKKK